MASPATFDGDAQGTGPYVVNVEESAADFATIVLDANADYWDPGAVGFEHVEYTLVPDNTARAAAFNAGQYDAAIGYISMGEPEGGSVDYINASIQMWMISDWTGERVPQLANKEVRCAMVEAFNREGIVTSLGEPETNAIYQPFREGQYGFIEDLDVPVFDPEAAQARFEATGEDGFSMVTGVATSDHITNGSLTPWSGVLGQFGITFEIETFESSTEYYVRAGQGVDDVISLPAADLNPLIPLIQRATPDGIFNPSGAVPEGVAELVESARNKSFEDAEEDISEAWRILIEECIWMPYMVLSGGWWVADNVEGFSTRAMPQGFNILGAHFTD
jgi:peptide/nickel transport system substrate-binding protein